MHPVKITDASRDNFRFDAEKHIYYLNDKPIPSCTQILKAVGIAPDFRNVEPKVLAYKRELGIQLHKALHYLEERDLDPTTIDDALWPYLSAYNLFIADHKFVAERVEIRRIATIRGMAYGMTLDVLGRMHKQSYLIDFKTQEGAPHYSWAIQTAAYSLGIDPPLYPPFKWRRASLQLFADGSYRFKEWKNPRDYKEFEWALALVWCRADRGEKPWEEK